MMSADVFSLAEVFLFKDNCTGDLKLDVEKLVTFEEAASSLDILQSLEDSFLIRLNSLFVVKSLSVADFPFESDFRMFVDSFDVLFFLDFSLEGLLVF